MAITIDLDKEIERKYDEYLKVLGGSKEAYFIQAIEEKLHQMEEDCIRRSEIKGIEQGLKDIKEGRVYSHEEAMARLRKFIKENLKKK